MCILINIEAGIHRNSVESEDNRFSIIVAIRKYCVYFALSSVFLFFLFDKCPLMP